MGRVHRTSIRVSDALREEPAKSKAASLRSELYREVGSWTNCCCAPVRPRRPRPDVFATVRAAAPHPAQWPLRPPSTGVRKGAQNKRRSLTWPSHNLPPRTQRACVPLVLAVPSMTSARLAVPSVTSAHLAISLARLCPRLARTH